MKIGCVIPAAGLSRRFGAADKLTAKINGMEMIRRVCDVVVASRVQVCFVVSRPAADSVAGALLGLPVSIVENHAAHTGMGSSIAAGISALDATVTGAFVLPADMPGMTPEFLNELIARFEAQGGTSIMVPVTPEGEQRNPVLWPSVYFSALKELRGDRGGKGLLQTLSGEVVRVEARDARLFADVDTLQDLAYVRGTGKH